MPHLRKLIRSLKLLLPVSAFVMIASSPAAPAYAGSEAPVWVTLGTHGGPLIGARAQPANALVVNGKIYLVDAGNGVAGQLFKAGLNLNDVAAIFVSHNHDDHNADMGTVAGLAYTSGRSDLLPIYGPPGTERAMQAFREFYRVNEEIRRSESGPAKPFEAVIATHDVAPGIIYQDDNVVITALENNHFHFPPNSPAFGHARSYAYKFQTKIRTIVYTGDTGPSDALTAFASDADVLVSEIINAPAMLDIVRQSTPGAAAIPEARMAMITRHFLDEHLSAEAVGKMATAARVKHLLLTHMVPDVAEARVNAMFTRDVRKYFSGKLTTAVDLGRY